MQIPLMSSFFKQAKRNVGWFAIGIGETGVHFAQVKLVGSRPQVVECAFFPVTEVTPAVLEKLRRDAHIGDRKSVV